ncbi:hypothetical protein [Aliidiomarina celeris]|nr:hypothetical protein [Aliidiomarina celeris]
MTGVARAMFGVAVRVADVARMMAGVAVGAAPQHERCWMLHA